ncbi:MAG: hypothetical protein KC443_23950, partial [Anaerolineales bacterium]|nr:hypothetical protein [Anaerolineales bacterium]
MDKKQATAASWQIKPMPAARRALELDGRYTAPEMAQIALGFIPREQQDKWFVYFDGEWLHVHRSWTGTCIFQLQLLPDGETYRTEQL